MKTRKTAKKFKIFYVTSKESGWHRDSRDVTAGNIDEAVKLLAQQLKEEHINNEQYQITGCVEINNELTQNG